MSERRKAGGEQAAHAQPPRGARGRFLPGHSGNPAGLTPGSRHKATLAALALLDGQAEALTQKAVELALAGDVTALRLCLERIAPPRKHAPLDGAITLPELNTTADLPNVTRAILAAVGDGRLTPGEAEQLTKLTDAHVRAVETAELAERIARLEARTR